MKRYLLTGTAGFIGAVVGEKLLDAGAEVVGIDNLNDAYDLRMKEYRLAKLKQRSGFSFLKLDVAQRSLLDNEALKGKKFEAVINLAARAGVRDSLIDPWIYLDTNVTGTLNLLEFCQREGISKFLLASTAGLYGDEAILTN